MRDKGQKTLSLKNILYEFLSLPSNNCSSSSYSYHCKFLKFLNRALSICVKRRAFARARDYIGVFSEKVTEKDLNWVAAPFFSLHI
jgi:hypothetical protein